MSRFVSDSNTKAPLRYLALGDSYTIGEGVSENERFPFFTVALLRAQGVSIADPEYLAATGWTTHDLLAELRQKKVSQTYDVVSLLIGVNDQYRGLDAAGYRTRFEELLDKAIALAGQRPQRVFVFSIPDYSATPFVAEKDKARVRAEVDAFNVINNEIARSRAVSYSDIAPLTRQAAADVTLLAPDHLHYSGKAHRQWAQRLATAIQKHV